MPFNELRSYAGYPNRPRTSPVALRSDRSRRAWLLNRASAVARALLAIFASRADLILENLALRQQLAVLRQKHPRPRLRASDRFFWLTLRRCWPRSWGAPRSHGEIQKLGLEVSERTVSRTMRRRPTHLDERQRWRTLLANHREFIAAIHHLGIEPKQITARSPWQNGVAERFVSTARRELLDHVIVLNEKHWQRLLAGFASYYLNDRTHLSLEKETPAVRVVEPKPHPAAGVIALPRLGGLHHRYAWCRAA